MDGLAACPAVAARRVDKAIVVEVEVVRAAADSWFQHLTYHTAVQEDSTNEWLEPVSDEQYYDVNIRSVQ